MQITIQSLGGLGDGVSELNGKPVFIPKTCVGDTLDMRIVRENQDAVHGTILRIITPGPERQAPPCYYFDHCGGCTLQQLNLSAYKAFKTRILREALSRAGFADAPADITFLPSRTRRRVEFKIQHNGNKIALAFYDLRSHDATAIDACLLLIPSLQSLIAPLNEALSHQDYSPYLQAVALTHADHGIDMMLIFKHYNMALLTPMEPLARKLGVARIGIKNGGDAAKIIVNAAPVEMQLGGYAIALPPESFLQATAEGQALLTQHALSGIDGAETVADLFCGIGSYSFPASRIAKVEAMELNAGMVQAVQTGVKRHAIDSLTASVRDLFKRPLTADELQRFSAVILNPPRIGAKAQTEALAASLVSRVVMISCNPATFARDAAILGNAGFSITAVHAIDQFIWSPHLEIAATFTR